MPGKEEGRVTTGAAVQPSAGCLDGMVVIEIAEDWIAAAVCGRLLSDFQHDRNTRGHVWLRWFNEVPVLLLFAAVILVIVKPF